MNNGDLQLLPSQKRHFSFGGFSGKSLLFLVSLALIMLAGIGYGVVLYSIGTTMDSIHDVDDQIAEAYRTRDKSQEEKLLNLAKQLGTTRVLLASHIRWSRDFSAVQALIEPRVTFSTLETDTAKRTYSFHAVADSYATVAHQIAAFYRSEAITDVTLTKVGSVGTGGIEFLMQLTLK